MGNSISCFDPVREHPPYSWPKDHPDRAAAIAEKKRQRRHHNIVGTQGNAHTAPVESPKDIDVPQEDKKSEDVIEKAVTLDVPPIKDDKDNKAETILKTIKEEEIAEDKLAEQKDVDADDIAPAVAEIKLNEEEKEAGGAEVKEEVIEPVDDISPVVAVDLEQTEREDVEKGVGEDIKEKVEEGVGEDLNEEVDEGATAEPFEATMITEDAEVVEEIDDTDVVGNEEEKIGEEFAGVEAEVLALAVAVSAVEAQVEAEKAVDATAEGEEVDAEKEGEADVDATVDVTDKVKTIEVVKEDIVETEQASIDKRRAMFEQSNEELAQPKELSRDVHDPVTGEFITLAEYRKRQMERAEGLVKERVEQYEDVDEATAQERAEFAAIEATRTGAIEKTRWKFKKDGGDSEVTDDTMEVDMIDGEDAVGSEGGEDAQGGEDVKGDVLKVEVQAV